MSAIVLFIIVVQIMNRGGYAMPVKVDLRNLARTEKGLRHVRNLSGLGGHLDVNGDLGIVHLGEEVTFLDLKNPGSPEVLGSVKINSDDYYANAFLGIKGDYAFFGIAYQGVEVVDISDVGNPGSLGLFKEYGSVHKMVLADDVAITSNGVMDISDIMRPRELLAFKSSGFDMVNDMVIVRKFDKKDPPIALYRLKKNSSPVLIAEINDKRLSNVTLHPLKENKFIFINRNGLGIIHADHIKGSLCIESYTRKDGEIMGRFVVGDRAYLEIFDSIRLFRYAAVSCNEEGDIKTDWEAPLDDPALFVTDGRYFLYSDYKKNSDYYVLKLSPDGIPSYVDRIPLDKLYPVTLVGDCIMSIKGNAIDIYSLPES